MMLVLYRTVRKSLNLERIIEILKKGALYFGASFLGLLLSIYTFPILSKYLSEKDFAVFNYFTNLSVFFTFIFALQFYVYFSASYYRCNEEEKKTLISTLVLSLLIWNPVILCIIYFALLIYFKYVHLTIPFYPYCFLALITVSASIYKGIYLLKLRLNQKATPFFYVSVIYKTGTILLGLFLVMSLSDRVLGRFYGVMYVEILVGIYCVFALLRGVPIRINRDVLRNAVKYIIPLLGASLIYYPVIGLDQITLERLNNTRELGFYSLGLTFAGYLHMLNYSVYQAIEPDIIKSTIHFNKRKLSVIIICMLGFTLFTSVAFIFTSKFLINYLTGGKFVYSANYCNILVMSYVFVISFSIGATILNALKLNKASFYTTLIGGLFSVIVYILAAKFGGFYTVAYTRILVFIVLTLISFYFVYKQMRIKGMI